MMNIKTLYILIVVLSFINMSGYKAQAAQQPQILKNTSLQTSRSLVLAIGIGKFNDPFWKPLQYAEQDAEKIKTFLTEKAEPRFDYFELLSTQNNATVSKQEITQAIERLRTQNRSEKDRIIIYISTHGTINYRKNGTLARYIITSDTDHKNLEQTALDYDELIRKFKALPSRKKALILAFCHSGTGKSQLTPEMITAMEKFKGAPLPLPQTEYTEGSLILAASGWSEPALEDPELKSDIYTHFLIEGMTKDTNNDGMITLTEAHDYATRATIAYTQNKQHPSAIVETMGGDPLILKGAPTQKRNGMLYTFYNWAGKILIRINNEPPQIVSKGAIELPVGKVVLSVSDAQTSAPITQRTLYVRPHQEVLLSQILTPEPLWKFDVRASSLLILNPTVRNAYLPSPAFGSGVGLERSNILSTWSLGLEFCYYPQLKENFTYNSITFTHKRQLFTLSANITNDEKISFLSSDDDTHLTLARMSLGLSTLIVNRLVLNESFAAPKQDSWSLGPEIRASLMHMWKNSVYLGLETSWAAYKNFFDAPIIFVPTLKTNVSIGYRW